MGWGGYLALVWRQDISLWSGSQNSGSGKTGNGNKTCLPLNTKEKYVIMYYLSSGCGGVLVCHIDAVNPDVDGTDAVSPDVDGTDNVSVSVCLALRMYEVMRCCAFSI